MKSLLRGFLICLLGLFLLGRTPAADTSPRLAGVALSSLPISNPKPIKNLDKPTLETLETLEISTFYNHPASAPHATPNTTPTPNSPQTQTQTQVQAYTAPASSYPAETPAAHAHQPDRVTIFNSSSPLFEASTSAGTLSETGSSIGVYNRFYYGHVTTSVFSQLKYLAPGNTFTITRSGVTRTYRVRVAEVIEKPKCTPSDASECALFNQIRAANHKGNYDVALMTCAGTLLGSDATHRLIIMASEV